MARRRSNWLLPAIAVVALIVVVGFLAWRTATEPTRLLTPIATITDERVTAVAAVAGQTLAEVGGPSGGVAVSAGGLLIGAQPSASSTVEARLASGTVVAAVVQSDPVFGLAVIDVAAPPSDTEPDKPPTLVLGRSADLRPGQQLILAPGGDRAPIRVTFLGRGQTEVEALGLIQYVHELALPVDVTVRQGAVLNADGQLVGIVVPDRQKGAGPGRVFAVPVEQATELFRRMGYIVETPTPEPTLRPTRQATPDDD